MLHLTWTRGEVDNQWLGTLEENLDYAMQIRKESAFVFHCCTSNSNDTWC